MSLCWGSLGEMHISEFFGGRTTEKFTSGDFLKGPSTEKCIKVKLC